MKYFTKDSVSILLGLIGFAIPFFVSIPGLSEAGHVALSIFIIAAVFWMLEPVPIYATSMLVILLQVFFLSKQGVLFPKATAQYTPNSYTEFIGTLANPIIILFLGGFVLAAAAVKFDLDKNITRVLLKPFGSRPKFIILGLMVVTALLSGFMSNTATTAMMMTVILPILAKTEMDDPVRIGLALCIPFAANIGGIATPIGTPPNAVVIGALSNQGIDIAFTEWMGLATPLVIVMLIASWVVLLWMFKPKTDSIKLDVKGAFQKNKDAIQVYLVFGLTIGLWITESLHGIGSSIIALLPVAILSLTGILDKDEIRGLPWEVLWLVAGGLSLGISMESTGLAEWIIATINWNLFSALMLIVVFGLVTIIMSNFLSHTVSATLLIPLAVSLATSGAAGEGFSLILISLVIGISSSMAMILPISTPPNAIAMSTGTLKTKHMTKSGLVIGAFGLLMVTLYALFYWPLLIN
ncbi:SLC13 family permease [Gracilimonas mengyeensis]|uniref:Solute carrier family 13 (Sodium-dependent dicarboxylate transporter), member 2/3/5 n=1 Tax=Gracilimonas mengyeensis TaxID=1302730 RepID=A0A521CGS6_9BACT|nr:SLC13 family permease [Gracilimonas mengyeensis]SMO58619.1 solute carrier family 13 (sodium-dependent dicarboxylate transporter), member 2/3/5 [Gracilimonas mengyeensis]